jgi:hypothetical protein
MEDTHDEKEREVKQEAEETAAAEARPMDDADQEAVGKEVAEVTDSVDIEKEAEYICRWGAARASVIVMTPFLGSLALMANEVYMITRLSDLRGIELQTGAIAGLIGSLGASFVGQTIFTIIPFPPLQVPMGVAITYAVGKAADAWLKAGQPKDMAHIREIFEAARKEGMARFKEFRDDPTRNIPLGDETKERMRAKAEPIFNKLKTSADEAANKMTAAMEDLKNSKEGPKGKVASVMTNVSEMADNVNVFLQPYKEMATRWISLQTWDQLRSGSLVVPYVDLSKGIGEALKDSDFTLTGCHSAGENLLELTVEHEKYGSITADIGIEAFALNNTASYGRFRIHDFAIADNKLGELVVKVLGTRIIMSLVNAVFNMKTVSRDDLVCTYSENTLTVDFTEVIKKSKVSQYKIKDRNLFDIVHLTALVPESNGLKVCSKWTLPK